MKLLNSSSGMGGLRRFVYYGMVEERDCLFMGMGGRERERFFIDGMGGRERERLFINRHRNCK